MLRYCHTIQNTSNSGQARAVHRSSENPAMAKSATALASGLDHLFSLGKDPLGPFRDVTSHTEGFEDENSCSSDSGEINDDLDRQAVEQEFRCYEEDGLSDTTSLVEFWEVGTVIPPARDNSRSCRPYHRNMNTFILYFSTS